MQVVGDAYFDVSLFARIVFPIRNLLTGYDVVRRSMSTSKTLVGLLAEPEAREGEARDPPRK